MYICTHAHVKIEEEKKGAGGEGEEAHKEEKRKGRQMMGSVGGRGAYHHLQLQASCHPLLLQYHCLLVHTPPAMPSRQNNKQETLDERKSECTNECTFDL